ncbi:hypothetical protein AB0L64_17865 [Kribbella sp. NPDC051936]|uniref:hypothetical protein n=1 Tax=Kribbella sp. NPDC051936 TaxID=3154946 RepID=UPI0034373B2C
MMEIERVLVSEGLMHTYNLVGPAVGEDYRALLRAVAPLAEVFGVLDKGPRTRMDESGNEVLRRLGEHLLGADEVQAWPGSVIVGRSTQDRYLFRLDDESLEVLTTAASSLFDWVWPRLPEDLHLLRADGSTVLGTVAQEDDAWLELTAAEYDAVTGRLPRGVRLGRG